MAVGDSKDYKTTKGVNITIIVRDVILRAIPGW